MDASIVTLAKLIVVVYSCRLSWFVRSVSMQLSFFIGGVAICVSDESTEYGCIFVPWSTSTAMHQM